MVGYCRWLLPDDLCDLKSEDLWPEGRIPPVTDEQAEKAKRDYDGADWNYDSTMGDMDGPLVKRKNELMSGKNYMGVSRFFVHRICSRS